MKLDRIKLAKLVVFLCDLGAKFGPGEVEMLDRLIEINVEPVTTQYVSVEAVNELLRCMMTAHSGTGDLLEAIAAYRALTGAGLKEAKEAVECY